MRSDVMDGAGVRRVPPTAWRGWTLPGLMMVLMGCNQQDGVGEPRQSEREETASVRVSALSDGSQGVPTTSLPELPSKDRIAAAVPIMDVLEPDAAEVRAHRVGATGELASWNAEASAKLERAHVPVLYPAVLTREQWAQKTRVTVGDHWYAIAMQDGELNVYIQGTRTRFEHPSLELDARGESLVKGAPHVVSRTHGIVTLSFERFGGLGYLIDVECRRPEEDERCARDAFIVSLYESLVRMPVSASESKGGVQ